MRSLLKNKHAAVGMIITGILILVLSVIAIAIVFPIISSVNVGNIDTNLQTALGEGTDVKFAANATKTVLGTTATVMGLNPIAALVAVAAGIISLLVGAFAFGGKPGAGGTI